MVDERRSKIKRRRMQLVVRCRRGRSEHLVVHGGVTTSGRLSSISTGGDNSIVTTLGGGEVIGHLSVELFDRLLLRAFATTTTSFAAATSTSAGFTSFTSTASGCRSLLGGSSRLWLILL
jgi:hypothetical protein